MTADMSLLNLIELHPFACGYVWAALTVTIVLRCFAPDCRDGSLNSALAAIAVGLIWPLLPGIFLAGAVMAFLVSE